MERGQRAFGGIKLDKHRPRRAGVARVRYMAAYTRAFADTALNSKYPVGTKPEAPSSRRFTSDQPSSSVLVTATRAPAAKATCHGRRLPGVRRHGRARRWRGPDEAIIQSGEVQTGGRREALPRLLGPQHRRGPIQHAARLRLERGGPIKIKFCVKASSALRAADNASVTAASTASLRETRADLRLVRQRSAARRLQFRSFLGLALRCDTSSLLVRS